MKVCWAYLLVFLKLSIRAQQTIRTKCIVLASPIKSLSLCEFHEKKDRQNWTLHVLQTICIVRLNLVDKKQKRLNLVTRCQVDKDSRVENARHHYNGIWLTLCPNIKELFDLLRRFIICLCARRVNSILENCWMIEEGLKYQWY